MGLVVQEIVDIIEERMHIELSSEREGFIGTAVIGGKATDIIDAGYYLTQAFHDWFAADRDSGDSERSGRRLLVVDDSPFFRNLLQPLPTVAGYDVVRSEEHTSDLQSQIRISYAVFCLKKQ